jgi:hypothetical protein
MRQDVAIAKQIVAEVIRDEIDGHIHEPRHKRIKRHHPPIAHGQPIPLIVAIPLRGVVIEKLIEVHGMVLQDRDG